MINNILLYNSGGGIGDAIQILALIITFKRELKNINLYYLSAHDNHFNTSLKDYNCPIDTFDLNIKYFGFRWWHTLIVKNRVEKKDINKFDLIIDLQSKIRNSLILKMIPHKYFISTCLNFKLCNPSINNIKKQKKTIHAILDSVNLLLKKNFQLIEFDINKIDKKFIAESKKLLPNDNYVGFVWKTTPDPGFASKIAVYVYTEVVVGLTEILSEILLKENGVPTVPFIS